VNYAEAETRRSDVHEEQIYLAITAIAKYHRSKPEILIAMDWIRTRRLEFGGPLPSRIYRVFADLRFQEHPDVFPGFENEGEAVSQWVLFLIVSTLMMRPGGREGGVYSDLPLSSFRILYKFIA
jgi:hypothetical protein